MAMGGRDRDIPCRDSGPGASPLARLPGDDARYADEIAEDEYDPRFALRQDHRLRLERVFRSGVPPLVVVAGHAIARRRRDVDLGDADAQRIGLSLGRSGAPDQKDESEGTPHFGATFVSARHAPSTRRWPPSGASLLDRAVRGS